MSAVTVEYPEIDFAMDAVPDLHDVLRDLRTRHAVAPVRYHGATAYMITRFGDLRSAMADDEAFPSAAAYARHTEPVMGRTIQCMGGDEHRRNRGLVSAAFRPRLMTEFVEAFLTPVAHELVDAIVEGQTGPRGAADLVADYTTRYAFTVITRLLDFPPTDFDTSVRLSISLLWTFSELKTMCGDFRDDGAIASTSSCPSIFLREVACLDLDALALKRAMNSLSSRARSSFFSFRACLCRSAISLAWRQKS